MSSRAPGAAAAPEGRGASAASFLRPLRGGGRWIGVTRTPLEPAAAGRPMAGRKPVLFCKSPWSVLAGWFLAEAAIHAVRGNAYMQGVRPYFVIG